MNMNQIINMVIRIIMRKAINSGISAGIGAASGMGRRKKDGAPEAVSEEGRPRQKQVQGSARQAQKMARLSRRITRL